MGSETIKLRQKIRRRFQHFREETYFTFTPILGPGSGGKYMMMSPLAAINELRQPKEDTHPRHEIEEIEFWLDDNIQIIINNHNADVPLNNLQAWEIVSLLHQAIKNEAADGELYALVHRFG